MDNNKLNDMDYFKTKYFDSEESDEESFIEVYTVSHESIDVWLLTIILLISIAVNYTMSLLSVPSIIILNSILVSILVVRSVEYEDKISRQFTNLMRYTTEDNVE